MNASLGSLAVASVAINDERRTSPTNTSDVAHAMRAACGSALHLRITGPAIAASGLPRTTAAARPRGKRLAPNAAAAIVATTSSHFGAPSGPRAAIQTSSGANEITNTAA